MASPQINAVIPDEAQRRSGTHSLVHVSKKQEWFGLCRKYGKPLPYLWK